MLPEKHIKTTGGLLLNGAMFLAAKTLSTYDKALTGGILTAVAEEVSKNFALKFIGDFGTYDQLYNMVISKHPRQLNHDVERVIKSASITALDYLKILYKEELEQDVLFFQACNEKEIKAYLKGIDLYFSEAKPSLETYLDVTPIDKDIIDDPNDFFKVASAQLILLSGVTFDEASRAKLVAFHEQYLPECFQLAFKETLKNDDKGFRAFQLWVLGDLKKQGHLTHAKLEDIENAISRIEQGFSLITNDVLETFGNIVLQHLERSFQGITVHFVKLAKLINRRFDKLTRQGNKTFTKLSSVETDTKQLLDIATRTARNTEEMHEKMNQLLAQRLNPAQLQHTQVIFANSEEVIKLIGEIDHLPQEIDHQRNRYEELASKFEAEPTEDNGDLMDAAHAKWVLAAERLEKLNEQLDDMKSSVMTLYHLFYLQTDVTERSETTIEAIKLFEAGKFTELEELLSSEAREVEREKLIREQELLDLKKKDMAVGDFLNAMTILRSRNYTEAQAEKGERYFKCSIAMDSFYYNHHYYARYLETNAPAEALQQYQLAIAHLDAQKDLEYGLNLSAIAKMHAELLQWKAADEKFTDAINFFRNADFLTQEERTYYLFFELKSRALILSSIFELQMAKALCQEAVDLLENNLQIFEEQLDQLRTSLQLQLGDMAFTEQELDVARRHYDAAYTNYLLLKSSPEPLGVMTTATMFVNLSWFFINIKDDARAKALCDEGYESLAALADYEPAERAFYQVNLLHREALMYLNSRDVISSESKFREALSITVSYLRLNLVRFRPIYSGLLIDYGNLSKYMNEWDRAGKLFEKALGILIGQLDSSHIPIYSQTVSLTLQYTEILLMKGETNAAFGYLQENLKFLYGITSDDSAFFRFELASILHRIASVLVTFQEYGEAEKMFDRSAAEFEFLIKGPSLRNVTCYIKMLNEQAEINAFEGHYDQAMRAITRAYELNERLRTDVPREYTEYEFGIAAAEAVVHLRQGKSKECLAAVARAESVMESLSDAINLNEYRAKIWRAAALMYQIDEQWEDAILRYQDCLKQYGGNEEEVPKPYAKAVLEIRHQLGNIYGKLKNREAQEEQYGLGITALVQNGSVLSTAWQELHAVYGRRLDLYAEDDDPNGYANCLIKRRALVVNFSGDEAKIRDANEGLMNFMAQFDHDPEMIEHEKEQAELFFQMVSSPGFMDSLNKMPFFSSADDGGDKNIPTDQQ